LKYDENGAGRRSAGLKLGYEWTALDEQEGRAWFAFRRPSGRY